MDRRSFLKAVGGAAVAAVAVPALVLPSKTIALPDAARTFFLPPAGGWQPEESALEYIQRYEQSTESVARYLLADWATTHYRITGFYDPDLALPMPGETVLLHMPNGMQHRAMLTEYSTEMYTDRAATLSVKFVGVVGGPEPTTEVNMRHPISWTTWHEYGPSRTERAGYLPNWS